MVKIGGKGWAKTPKIHFISAWKKMDSPTVAMMTEITGSPIKGRSTTTCSTMPKMVMKARHIGKASQKGNCRWVISHQQAQAPTSRNSPCAKFTTCDAL